MVSNIKFTGVQSKKCLICGIQCKNSSRLAAAQCKQLKNWRCECVTIVCDLFKLNSENSCYKYILDRCTFCTDCEGAIRDVGLSWRTMWNAEIKLLESISFLETRLKGQCDRLTPSSQCKEKMEDFEKLTDLGILQWDSRSVKKHANLLFHSKGVVVHPRILFGIKLCQFLLFFVFCRNIFRKTISSHFYCQFQSKRLFDLEDRKSIKYLSVSSNK